MSIRYMATFDSLSPLRGVLVDDREDRHCFFPSLEKAQDAADRWNQPALIESDPPMIWRSNDTGERLDNNEENY